MPGPGESAAAVAQRIFRAWSAEPGVGSAEARRWRARLARVTEGAIAARALLADEGPGPLFRRQAATASEPEEATEQTAWRMEHAALLLDVGDPVGARAMLEPLVEGDGPAPPTRALRLLDWSRLLADPSAPPVGGLPSMPRGPVPASLVELRARRHAWARRLAGRARVAPEGRGAATGAEADPRSTLGADTVLLFGLPSGDGEGCASGPWLAECEPAASAELGAALELRSGRCATAGYPEHELCLGGRAVVRHAVEGPPQGAFLPTARALALTPVQREDGALVGWVHAEFGHHLVPSASRLERLARQLAPALCRALQTPRAELELRVPDPRALELGELVTRIVADAGLGCGRDALWAFDVQGDSLTLAALGAAQQGGAEELAAHGGAGCVARALRCRAECGWPEPDARLSLTATPARGSRCRSSSADRCGSCW